MTETMIKSIAVDFGVSALRALIVEDDSKAQTSAMDESRVHRLRSAAMLEESGEIVVGERAYARSLVQSERCHLDALRYLGQAFDEAPDVDREGTEDPELGGLGGVETARGEGGDVQLRVSGVEGSVGLPVLGAEMVQELFDSLGEWRVIRPEEQDEGNATTGLLRSDEDSEAGDEPEGPLSPRASSKTDSRDCSSVCFAVPAGWSSFQVQALKQVCQIAGVDEPDLVSSMTVLALAYRSKRLETEREKIVLCDIGASGARVSLVDVDSMGVDVRATVSSEQIGGNLIDEAIVEWLKDQVPEYEENDALHGTSVLMRMRDAAEKAKIRLSDEEYTEIHLPYLWADVSGAQHLRLEFSREQFEGLIRRQTDHVSQLVDRLMSSAGCGADEIDSVVVAGGTCRIPVIQDQLEGMFSKIPNLDLVEKESCVLGLELAMRMGGEERRESITERAFEGLEIHRDGEQVATAYEEGQPFPLSNEFELEEGVYDLCQTTMNGAGGVTKIASFSLSPEAAGAVEFSESKWGDVVLRSKSSGEGIELNLLGGMSAGELSKAIEQRRNKELVEAGIRLSQARRKMLVNHLFAAETLEKEIFSTSDTETDSDKELQAGGSSEATKKSEANPQEVTQEAAQGLRRFIDEAKAALELERESSSAAHRDLLGSIDDWLKLLPTASQARFEELLKGELSSESRASSETES